MNLAQMSFSGAVMIIVILLVRAVAINRLPKRVFVVLWEAAFLRLLIPISIPSVFSAYSMVRENHITQEVFTESAVSYLIPEAQEVQFASTALIPEAQEVPSAVAALIPEVQEVQSAVSVNMAEVIQNEIHTVPAEAPFPFWTVLWVAGMLICALFFLISYLRCYREFRMSLPVCNAFVEEWLQGHRIKRGIRIRQSDRILSPLTYGIFCPVILMPKTTDWEDIQRLQYVLQHEYVHIRRFDMIRKFAAALVLCIHWFNPAVWIMYVIYNRDIELSCDESVIRRFGESSKSFYAKALIAMEEKRNRLQPLSNSFSKNAIEERIKAVMKTKKVTVWALFVSMAVIVMIIVLFATSANVLELDEQKSMYIVSGEDTDGQAATEEDVIAFFDTITEDMLIACEDYPSEESYWNDPIVLLDRVGGHCLYGISVNGQEAMIYYENGEKILIEHPFRNFYQERPELRLSNIDNDAMYEVIISLRTITGNIRRYDMIVCDHADQWNVYQYDDYLKDVEETIRWQYDEQKNSILFINNEGIILAENTLPEWAEEYPFAGNVNFDNGILFDAYLMQLRVEPQIELERSLPYMPIEIVFQINYENGDFSLGGYYIQENQNGTPAQGLETLENQIGMEYTGNIEGINISDYIEKYVTLTDDTEIERWEMLNHNGKNILRIRVGYNQEDLRGTIQGHKEDYFIFLDGNGNAGYVLQVGYEDKIVDAGCDYRVIFEDVTFDGNDDLIIWLGGTRAWHYCAFIYEDGQYRYEKTFESIPGYQVDTENQVIRGYQAHSAMTHSYYTYEYQNGEFVLIEEIKETWEE